MEEMKQSQGFFARAKETLTGDSILGTVIGAHTEAAPSVAQMNVGTAAVEHFTNLTINVMPQFAQNMIITSVPRVVQEVLIGNGTMTLLATIKPHTKGDTQVYLGWAIKALAMGTQQTLADTMNVQRLLDVLLPDVFKRRLEAAYALSK